MGSFPESTYLVGNSEFCRTIREKVPVFASLDLPILILGETGTGKDVIARMIHAASQRADKVFLSMNCATLGSLADSELFGHVSGAFTGAVRGTRGFIGSADEGTLLLDEIGELSPDVQAKLLRFLDNGEYYRVGDATARHADVRIIAATNQDLETLVKEGRFREDLYYRLCGTVIRTVPLSERREDIPPLVQHFIRMYAEHYRQDPVAISPEAIKVLCDLPWPGNVRQLKHTVFRLCHLASGKKITLAHLREGTSGIDSPLQSGGREGTFQTETYKEAKKRAIEAFEHHYFTKLLETTHGNVKKALKISGLHKKNFYTKIRSLGIEPKKFRQGG